MAEQSHGATRVRERGMRKFKSVRQAQRFLCAYSAVSNLLNLGRHVVRVNIIVTLVSVRSMNGVARLLEKWGSISSVCKR